MFLLRWMATSGGVFELYAPSVANRSHLCYPKPCHQAARRNIPMNQEKTGQLICRLRIERGLTQLELANQP